MLHELNMVARNYELVSKKQNEEAQTNSIIDPDKFPIQRLAVDLVTEHESLWTTKVGKEMLRYVEAFHGH